MKAKHQLVFILFLSFAFKACDNKKHQNMVEIPAINMFEAIEIDFNSLVEDVNCLVLEESPDAFLYDSWKIIKHKEFYYLYSLSDFAVCIFDNKGTLVKRIDGKGRGAIETPCDIYINEIKDQLWIIESQSFINKYSLRGEFIKKEKLAFKAVKLAKTHKGNYLFYNGGFDKELNHYIKQVLTDFNTTNCFVKKTIENHTIMPPSLFTNDDNNINVYSLLPKNDTIYICNKDEQFKPFLHLNFNGKLLTFKDFPTSGFTDKEMADIINKKEKVYSIDGFNFASGMLFMQLRGYDSSYRVIDLKNCKLYKFNSLIDNIPLASAVTNIQGSTTTNLLLSIDAEQLLNEYSMHNNNTRYGSIKKLLESPKSIKNRVIIEIKIKNKL